MPQADLYQAFYDIIENIPAGQVASYGQIAALAGHPRHARHVGFALSALSGSSTVPWHRVVSSQGRIPSRGSSGSDDFQRLLLEEEGIEFSLHDRINMRRYQWQP